MKITRFVILALAIVSAGVFTSCKDYEEDTYNNVISEQSSINAALQSQINALNKALENLKTCPCKDMASKAYVDEQVGIAVSAAQAAQTTANNAQTTATQSATAINALNQAIIVLCQNITGKTEEDPAKALNALIVNLNTQITDLQILAAQKADQTALDEVKKLAEKAINESVKTTDFDTFKTNLNTQLEGMQIEINDLKSRIEKIENALASLITGIVLQSVDNPVVNINTPFGFGTNVLLAYHGEALNSIEFPSVDPMYEIASGTLVGSAGKVYLTINPSTVDFTGATIDLVNSQDEASAIKLSPLAKSDAVLKYGISRAADNGFYECEAILNPSDISNPKLKIAIDKSSIKDAITNLAHTNSKASAKTTLKAIANAIAKNAEALNLERLGVKASYKTFKGETANVYSGYDIAAVSVKPLGFYTLENTSYFPKANFPGYMKARKLVGKVHEKFVNTVKKQLEPINSKIDKISDDLNIQIKHIDLSGVGGIDIDFRMNIGTDGVNYTCHQGDPAKGEDNTYLYIMGPDPNSIDKTTGKPTKYTQIARFKISDNPDDIEKRDENLYRLHLTQDLSKFKDVLAEIQNAVNGTLDDTNDQLKTLVDDVNDLLDEINTIENKITGDSYMARIYNYLDKINNLAVKAYNKIPYMAYPAVLVNSEAGFTIAGFRGAATAVKGQVVIYPTTKSAELMAPVYKKYLKINGNAGKIIEKSDYTNDLGGIDITDQLVDGENYITYSALDFFGNEITIEAVLVK